MDEKELWEEQLRINRLEREIIDGILTTTNNILIATTITFLLALSALIGVIVLIAKGGF